VIEDDDRLAVPLRGAALEKRKSGRYVPGRTERSGGAIVQTLERLGQRPL
jgi:hypothetical protein